MATMTIRVPDAKHERLKKLDNFCYSRSGRSGKRDRPHACFLRSERVAQLSLRKLCIEFDGFMRELRERHVSALLDARLRQRNDLARFENVALHRSVAAFPSDEIVNGLRPLHRRDGERLGRVDGDELGAEKLPCVGPVQREQQGGEECEFACHRELTWKWAS